MESWPNTVRYKPLVDTFQLQAPFRAPLVTDMDGGPKRRRRSSSVNIATVAMSIPMSAAEFSTFVAWVRDDLVDGGLPFLMSIFTPAGYVTRSCNLQNGLYQAAPRGTGHLVSLVLDVEGY